MQVPLYSNNISISMHITHHDSTHEDRTKLQDCLERGCALWQRKVHRVHFVHMKIGAIGASP